MLKRGCLIRSTLSIRFSAWQTIKKSYEHCETKQKDYKIANHRRPKDVGFQWSSGKPTKQGTIAISRCETLDHRKPVIAKHSG
jgi:hypothetical protein